MEIIRICIGHRVHDDLPAGGHRVDRDVPGEGHDRDVVAAERRLTSLSSTTDKAFIYPEALNKQ